MSLTSAFFPGFHRAGLGRKPAAAQLRIALQTRKLDGLCLAHLETLLGNALPSWLRTFKAEKGANSRKRTFTPILTFWAFLSQVFDPDSSCRRALSRVQALCAAKDITSISDCTGAYCKARARLCARMLIRVLRHVTDAVAMTAGDFGSQGSLLVMDGTVLTMPDTEANRAVYSHAPGQKPGCGFPQMHLLGLFDLRTGAWLRVVKSAARRHDSALAWKLLGFLRAGDTLVADRAFCSHGFIAACQRRGVQVVMRLHQAREINMRKGKRLGKGDRLQTWSKPAQAPKGMPAARHAAMPATQSLRIVATHVEVRGHRPETMYLATTLTDARAHSPAQIAALYLRRWEVELFFDDIKTSQSLDTLRCQSPHMVARELLMHMIAHNLVRLVMAQAGKQRPAAQEGRLSYRGTLDPINQWHCTLWACRSARQASERYTEAVASDRRRCRTPTPRTARTPRGEAPPGLLQTHDPTTLQDAPAARTSQALQKSCLSA